MQHVPDISNRPTAGGPAERAARAQRSRWLEGVNGRLKLIAGGSYFATLNVRDGRVSLTKQDEPADATIICKTEEVARRVLRGEGNPIVEGLQGRLEAEGDIALAIRVLLSLAASTTAASRLEV